MENEKNIKKFEEPKLEIIQLSETDIIKTSGLPYESPDHESEMV